MAVNAGRQDFYITGIGAVSPQPTCDSEVFFPDVVRHEGNVLACLTPDLGRYLTPVQARRLGRMMRLGLAAAAICLHDAGIGGPDGVVLATGWGFQDDMGKFLLEMIEQEERYVTPTTFMQSTHNALAGAIALAFGCTGYNSTYAGRGFAFETALDDAMLQLEEDGSRRVLVGSFDEASAVQHAELTRTGRLKRDVPDNLRLFEYATEGTLQGEGTAMFVLSSAPGLRRCRLRGLQMIYGPDGYRELTAEMDEFLRTNGLSRADVDVYVDGASGDVTEDGIGEALYRHGFERAARVRFKHLTGEYATASSFALWLSAMILRHGRLPDAIRTDPAGSTDRIEKVLICNHFGKRYYSFMLLDK